MVEVIGLAGYAQTGKDTVGKILVEEHGFVRYSFADKLKEAIRLLDPIIMRGHIPYTFSQLERLHDGDLKHLPEVRDLYQRFGTDAMRKVYPDVWVEALYNSWSIEHDKIVITDVRFPNEVEAIQGWGGDVYRVIRPGYGPVNDHFSETALDDYPLPSILNNDTIDHLEEVVTSILKVV